MSYNKSKLVCLPGLAAGLSLIACYGTLAVVAILGALGVSIALDNVLWAGTIVTFASLTVVGLAVGFLRHRQVWSVFIGGLGATAIGYVMYVQYSRLIELSGFAFLVVAAVWDWRLRRLRPPGTRIAK